MKYGRAVLIAGVACAAVAAVLACARAQEHGTQNAERARMAISQRLPPMDGNHLEVKLVEVNYGPAQASEAHSHPCAVVAYVAEGTIRSQVDAGPEKVYKAGETFYEPPNGVHRVSANGSATAPARLLAYFVCDKATPLTVPPLKPSSNDKP